MQPPFAPYYRPPPIFRQFFFTTSGETECLPGRIGSGHSRNTGSDRQFGGANPNPPGNYDDDNIHGLAATDDGVCIAGATQSPDFPIVLGYDEILGSACPDGFVPLPTSDLSTVIAATYIGTEYFDQVRDPAVNPDGTVVIVLRRQRVYLDGRGFSAPDGQIVQYHWTQLSGKNVSISNADAAVASFYSPQGPTRHHPDPGI